MNSQTFLVTVLALLTWLLFPNSVAAQSNYNEITYEIPNAYYQAAGRSTQVSATLEYDDTTHIIEALEFEVPLYSFTNTYGGSYNYIAAFGSAYNFPWLRFESKKVKEEGKNMELQGTLYFRGEYRPIHMNIQRTEKDEILYLDGDFTINLRDYFLLAPATVRIPPYLDMQLHLVFDLSGAAEAQAEKTGRK